MFGCIALRKLIVVKERSWSAERVPFDVQQSALVSSEAGDAPG